MSQTLPSALWMCFGARLADARTEAGLTVGGLGDLVGESAESIASVERAHRRPSRSLVEQLDTALDADGALTEAWAGTVQDEAFPRRFDDLAALEVHADHIWEHQSMTVPVYLRTADYSRAVLGPSHPGTPAETVEEWVREEVRRGAALAGPDAPTLRVVLNETALLRPFGGPEVLNAQRDALAARIASGSVELGIIPEATPNHPGLSPGFRVMTFTGRPRLVYAFHALGGTLISDDEGIGHCEMLMDRIIAAALPLTPTAPLLTDRYPDGADA
ncbi:helix-turn-helix domain-containing protein [Allonocardiopsis opalescens]|uniref:Helix-turn-helix protein n=1 Tax=Allonocardiopsis opalescens TaxID=1144618 RepID=A0A2T0Q2W6_9ACTN|nr:helix-turn-helix transcriptional regulator [Allonocardiopsis opalescens]PRX98129.1 helix-turn-helix protein [Allonocardiopsis opalescens]